MSKFENSKVISVIVPVYNVEMYLDRCVDSIVHQTYQELEIILVDDGSTDNSSVLCDSWALKDSRISVIHKKNGGLSDTRNTGLKVATGEYVSFVDSDDYIEPTMYSEMIACMEECGANIACCGRKIVKDGKCLQIRFTADEIKIFSDEEAIREIFLNRYMNEAAWDKIYRRRLFDDVVFPVGEINEDIVIMPTLMNRSKRIAHIGKSFYNYCQDGVSITRSGYTEKKRVILNHLEMTKQYIEQNYINLIPDFKILQARYTLSTLYLFENDIKTKKQYVEDYKLFLKKYRQVFKEYIFSGAVSNEEKIKGILVFFNIYSLLRNFKKCFE